MRNLFLIGLLGFGLSAFANVGVLNSSNVVDYDQTTAAMSSKNVKQCARWSFEKDWNGDWHFHNFDNNGFYDRATIYYLKVHLADGTVLEFPPVCSGDSMANTAWNLMLISTKQDTQEKCEKSKTCDSHGNCHSEYGMHVRYPQILINYKDSKIVDWSPSQTDWSTCK